MTKKTQEIKAEEIKAEETKNNKESMILPLSGKKVEIEDVSKVQAHLLIKAQRVTNSDEVLITDYILSQICTFDGEQISMDEIHDLPLNDLIELRAFYVVQQQKKIAQAISARKT